MWICQQYKSFKYSENNYDWDVPLAPSSSDFGIDEWKNARELSKDVDGQQHDLRKYGFTFLSALIAADSLTKLFYDADERIILGVVGVTLLLTVALSLFDRRYELFKHAIAIRAKILEARLNLELTETIHYRSKMDNFEGYVFWIYATFAAVAGIVGVFVLYPRLYSSVLVALLTITAVIALYAICRIKPNLSGLVDWSLDRVCCKQGEKVRVTATNLCPDRTATYEANAIIWEIRKEGETETAFSKTTPVKIVIPKDNNYSWELSTEELKPGIYRFFPSNPKEAKMEGLPEGLWQKPLKRAIVISDPT